MSFKEYYIHNVINFSNQKFKWNLFFAILRYFRDFEIFWKKTFFPELSFQIRCKHYFKNRTKESGANGLKRHARPHVVRVQESDQEHVKEKESEEALINRQSAE